MDKALSKAEVGIAPKEPKGAEPRKHHFVPQFYLRGFVGEKDMLLVTDRETKKPYRTKPHGVAGQRDFNRIEVEGTDPNAVEKALSEFEGEIAPHLDRVIAAKSVANEEDRAAVVNLMAALTLRNPKRRKAIGGVLARGTRSLFGRKQNYDEYVAEMKKAGKWDEKTGFTHEELQRELAGMNLEPAKEVIIGVEIDQHDRVTEHLLKRKWQMVVASEDSGGFVTSDDPVCVRWTDGAAHGDDKPGFAEQNSEVIFPLSTKLALRGTFDGEDNVINADASVVGTINSHIISNAERQVYAHNHSFKFMREEPAELGSGATLLQDKRFLAAAKPKEDKVVTLRGK